MNMVSESDLPRPVSGPMQNASADDLQQEVAVRRLGQYLKQLQPARERQEVPIRKRGWSDGRRPTYSRQHIHLLP